MAPQAVDSKNVFQNLVKQTLEAFLELELEEQIGYSKYAPEVRGSGNSHNGSTPKTVRGDFGEIDLNTPRDRNGEFDPKIVAKRQTSVGNFTDTVISLYTRGMTTREIEEHVKEIYGTARTQAYRAFAPVRLASHRAAAAADHRLAKPAARAPVSCGVR